MHQEQHTTWQNAWTDESDAFEPDAVDERALPVRRLKRAEKDGAELEPGVFQPECEQGRPQ